MLRFIILCHVMLCYAVLCCVLWVQTSRSLSNLLSARISSRALLDIASAPYPCTLMKIAISEHQVVRRAIT